MNHIRHSRTLKKKRTHKKLRLGGANIHSRISGFFPLQTFIRALVAFFFKKLLAAYLLDLLGTRVRGMR